MLNPSEIAELIFFLNQLTIYRIFWVKLWAKLLKASGELETASSIQLVKYAFTSSISR